MTNDTSTIFSLPQISVQPDFELKHGEDFWISFYTAKGSVHTKIKATESSSSLSSNNTGLQLALMDVADADSSLEITAKSPLDFQIRLPIAITTSSSSSSSSSSNNNNNIISNKNDLNVNAVSIIKPSKQSSLFDGSGSSSTSRSPTQIHCLDLSPSQALVLVGGGNGTLKILETTSKSGADVVGDLPLFRSLDGHIGDVTACKFFPSGQVVLSAGMDRRIKIWGLDGECAATINTLHTRTINSLGIVGRGRNILSASADGTIKLWECATSSLIRGFQSIDNSSFNCMTVGECTTISFDSPPTSKGHRNHSPLDPREHDTSNKLVFGATDNGALLGYDVSSSSSSPIIQIGATNGDALTACTFSNTDNLIACGSECGVISIYDLRSTISPLISMQRRKNVQVNSLSLNQRIASQRFNYQHSSSSSSGLILTVAGNDGSVALIDVMQDTTTAAAGGGGDGGHGTCSHPQLMAELIGADLEPIRGLAVSRNTIVTGERGGVVRMYSL